MKKFVSRSLILLLLSVMFAPFQLAAEPAPASTTATTEIPLSPQLNPELSGQESPSSSTALPSHSTLRPPTEIVRIAIIIDDLGYNLRRGVEVARLPGALTLAVLPHSPNGIALAELGHQQGKLIMLHTPMSNLQQLPLDAGGLTDQMTQQEFVDTLYSGLDSIPHIQGVNNHMGSYLTQLPEPMSWLMDTLAREQLFFVDSRTSPDSIAWETARDLALPTQKRDIFLDNERTAEAIGTQFDQLLRIAKRRGNAIAIGHPYPETVAFLTEVLPGLAELGVELVPVTQLIPKPALSSKPVLLEGKNSALQHRTRALNK